MIYAPALATMEPRTGRWGGGGPEHSLLGAATTEMARFYGLPVIASNGGTDHFVTGVQAAYERTLNWTLPVLSWPDIMIGPGSLGGASTLCLEQMVIDVEVYRMCRRLHEGIGAGVGETDVLEALDEVGPVGDFLARTQTRDAVRGGEWFMPRLGSHATFDRWEAAGRPDVVGQAREVAMTRDRRPPGHSRSRTRWPRRWQRLEQAARSGAPAPATTGVRRAMRYEAAFLSADEQARVHEASLRILAEVGIRVHGDVALPLLRGGGRGGRRREAGS